MLGVGFAWPVHAGGYYGEVLGGQCIVEATEVAGFEGVGVGRRCCCRWYGGIARRARVLQSGMAEELVNRGYAVIGRVSSGVGVEIAEDDGGLIFE